MNSETFGSARHHFLSRAFAKLVRRYARRPSCAAWLRTCLFGVVDALLGIERGIREGPVKAVWQKEESPELIPPRRAGYDMPLPPSPSRTRSGGAHECEQGKDIVDGNSCRGPGLVAGVTW